MKFLEIKKILLNTHWINDNEYLDKYCQLILKNLENKFNVLTSQKHHILPRTYFVLSKQNINSSKGNLVNLLYKDHVLAHYYLCLCAKEKRFFINCFVALRCMLSVTNYNGKTLKEYEPDLFAKLDKLQEIYQKSKLIQKNEDLSFYEKYNEARLSGKPIDEISKEFKLTPSALASKYHFICKRNGLEIVKIVWYGNDIDFYNSVNDSVLNDKTELQTVIKKFSRSKENILKQYNLICERNKYENIYLKNKYALPESKISLYERLRYRLWEIDIADHAARESHIKDFIDSNAPTRYISGTTKVSQNETVRKYNEFYNSEVLPLRHEWKLKQEKENDEILMEEFSMGYSEAKSFIRQIEKAIKWQKVNNSIKIQVKKLPQVMMGWTPEETYIIGKKQQYKIDLASKSWVEKTSEDRMTKKQKQERAKKTRGIVGFVVLLIIIAVITIIILTQGCS